MKISEPTIPVKVLEKLERKHNVHEYEVHEVFANNPYFRKVGKGKQPGEDVYSASGRTDSGRYLQVFFIYKKGGRALVISAY